MERLLEKNEDISSVINKINDLVDTDFDVLGKTDDDIIKWTTIPELMMLPEEKITRLESFVRYLDSTRLPKKEKSLIIICITLILCVSIICGTILLTHNTNKINDTNNSAINNTTVNSTINETTFNNTTATKTSTSKSSSKKNSSSSDEFNGEKVKDRTYNNFGEEIITTENNVYIRNPENGAYKEYFDPYRGN